MEHHYNDVLFIFSKDDFSSPIEYNTRTFERIIYADNEKAITYYNGKYITYSLEHWKKINKQNADEIKEGGSYTFDVCGEYIFVFDENTKLLYCFTKFIKINFCVCYITCKK